MTNSCRCNKRSNKLFIDWTLLVAAKLWHIKEMSSPGGVVSGCTEWGCVDGVEDSEVRANVREAEQEDRIAEDQHGHAGRLRRDTGKSAWW